VTASAVLTQARAKSDGQESSCGRTDRRTICKQQMILTLSLKMEMSGTVFPMRHFRKAKFKICILEAPDMVDIWVKESSQNETARIRSGMG